MKINKIISLATLVILLISSIFCTDKIQFSNQNDNENSVLIVNKFFKLPENSFIYNPNHLDISTQEGVLRIYKQNQQSIDSGIDDYINESSKNFTITKEDFDCKIPCKKTIATNNDYTVCKYWFKLDDGLYVIQVNKNNAEYDKIAKDMINSVS